MEQYLYLVMGISILMRDVPDIEFAVYLTC